MDIITKTFWSNVRIYKRKNRRVLGKRRCVHWSHIRMYGGVYQKLKYILNRLLGFRTPSADLIGCTHIEDVPLDILRFLSNSNPRYKNVYLKRNFRDKNASQTMRIME